MTRARPHRLDYPPGYEGRKAFWRALDRHRAATPYHEPPTQTTTTGGAIMAGDTTITVVGNLTADPEMRYTPSGAPVASFTVASTPRTYDRQSGQWRDGETLFLRCSIWREVAENVAETLRKGMRVIVQGRLTQHSYQDRDGNNRTAFELQVEEVGPSLRFARAEVRRVQQGGGQGQAPQQGGGQASYGAPQGGSQGDPWASGADQFGSEPPF